jgi:hypothetical protein
MFLRAIALPVISSSGVLKELQGADGNVEKDNLTPEKHTNLP